MASRDSGEMALADLVTGLLTYFVGTDYIYALLINQRGQTRRFRLLSCQEAFPLLDRLAGVIEQPIAHAPSEVAAVFDDFCRRWGRHPLPPPEELQPFDVLVIIPHHFLHGVPLHLVSLTDDTPLAATFGITYCSSGTLFTRCVERNRARHPALAAATPTMTAAAHRGVPSRPPRTCVSVGLDVLTGKQPAYQSLAAAFGAHFQTVYDAWDREYLKNHLDFFRSWPPGHNTPDAICIVSHGYVDPAAPGRSGLLLADNRGFTSLRNVRIHRNMVVRVRDYPFADIPLRLEPTRPQPVPVGFFDPAPLTVDELKVNCTTDAELVALLGCSTGSGQVVSADELTPGLG